MAYALEIVGVVLAIGVLAIELYVIGHGPKLGLGGVVDAWAAAIERPAVSVAFALAAVVLGAALFRRLWLAWLAYSPGPIHVLDFRAGDDCGDVDATALTSVFRSRLARLSLHAPTPVPGATGERALLDVLGKPGDLSTPAAFARLARWALPPHAYEIQGILQRRDGERGAEYGVVAQVLRLPNEGGPPIAVWAGSWEEAVQEAADEATSMLLPRTRLCRRQWIGWQGHVMPPGLLVEYERGSDCERRGRFEDALEHYCKALNEDPFNLAIRLQVGQLHERAGNVAQAFATYHGIIDVTLPAAEELPADLYSRRARKERARIIAIARYRRALALGNGVIATAWWRGQSQDDVKDMILHLMEEHWDVRLPPPEALRERTHFQRAPDSGETLGKIVHRSWLQSRASLPATSEKERWRELVEHLLAAPSTLTKLRDRRRRQHDPRLMQLRVLFAAIALALAQQHARAWKRLRSSRNGSADPLLFTETSMLLSVLAIRLRLAFARDIVARARPAAIHVRDRPEGDRPSAYGESELAQLSRHVRSIVGPVVEQWHDAYNVACIYGIALQGRRALGGLETDADELAQEAVEWLETATARADSAVVGASRMWLLEQDPDLNELRDTPQFKAWRSIYFPGSGSDGSRAGNAVRHRFAPAFARRRARRPHRWRRRRARRR